jgi:hypothetical protein
VIEFNSITANDSASALGFVFKNVCSKSDLEKCTVCGLADLVTSVAPGTLLEIVATAHDFILHFHKCKLDHQQLAALSISQCALIF